MALRRSDRRRTGSLTVGKRADIILIRGNDLNLAPVANIETSVVQSATPANVDTVLVDGRIVKRGGRGRLRRRADRAQCQGIVAPHSQGGRRGADGEIGRQHVKRLGSAAPNMRR